MTYAKPNSFMESANQFRDSCRTLGLFCVVAKSMTWLETWQRLIASAMHVNVSAAIVPFFTSANFSVISFKQASAVVLQMERNKLELKIMMFISILHRKRAVWSKILDYVDSGFQHLEVGVLQAWLFANSFHKSLSWNSGCIHLLNFSQHLFSWWQPN